MEVLGRAAMKDVGSKRDKYVRKCGKPTGTVNGRKAKRAAERN